MSPVGEQDGADKGPNVEGTCDRVAALPMSSGVGLDRRRGGGRFETFRKVAAKVSAFRGRGGTDVRRWGGSGSGGRGRSGGGTGEGQTGSYTNGRIISRAVGEKRCRGEEAWKLGGHGA